MITSLSWTLSAVWQLYFLSLFTVPLSRKYLIPSDLTSKGNIFSTLWQPYFNKQKQSRVFSLSPYLHTHLHLCVLIYSTFSPIFKDILSLLRLFHMSHPFSRIQQLSPLFPLFFIFPWRLFLFAHKHATLSSFFKKQHQNPMPWPM